MKDDITYREQLRAKNGFKRLDVILGKRKVGEIRNFIDGGYAYFHRGGMRGEAWPTVEAVKRDIEGEA